MEMEFIVVEECVDEILKVIDWWDVFGWEMLLYLVVWLSDLDVVEMLMSVGVDWSL